MEIRLKEGDKIKVIPSDCNNPCTIIQDINGILVIE